MKSKSFKMLVVLFIFALAGCDRGSTIPYLEPRKSYQIYKENVKCVAELNHYAKVLKAEDSFDLDRILNGLNDSKFVAVPFTKVKDNRPDFYETFVSFKNCEETEKILRKNRDFEHCIISLKEISISGYFDLFENPNSPAFTSPKGKLLPPLKC